MTGIFFTARLASTRLREKHFILAGSRPFIKWLVDRFASEFNKEIANGTVQLFITTSLNPENKKFEELENVTVFYGSDENIPMRHLQCAQQHNVENIITIDGDDVLCSTAAARQVLNKLNQGKLIVQTKGLPLGMNVAGYKTSLLKKALALSNTTKLETGWGRIFDNMAIEYIKYDEHSGTQMLRFTLDYEQDADFFKKIIENIGTQTLTITDTELIELVINNKWYLINASLNQQYWANFNNQKKSEQQ